MQSASSCWSRPRLNARPLRGGPSGQVVQGMFAPRVAAGALARPCVAQHTAVRLRRDALAGASRLGMAVARGTPQQLGDRLKVHAAQPSLLQPAAEGPGDAARAAAELLHHAPSHDAHVEHPEVLVARMTAHAAASTSSAPPEHTITPPAAVMPPTPAPAAQPAIPASIWVISLVSMSLTLASCVFNTLLPIYMVTELKMTMRNIGMFEGLLEAFSYVVRMFSGAHTQLNVARYDSVVHPVVRMLEEAQCLHCCTWLWRCLVSLRSYPTRGFLPYAAAPCACPAILTLAANVVFAYTASSR